MTDLEIVQEAQPEIEMFPGIPLACPTCGSKSWGGCKSVGEYWRKCMHGLQAKEIMGVE